LEFFLLLEKKEKDSLEKRKGQKRRPTSFFDKNKTQKKSKKKSTFPGKGKGGKIEVYNEGEGKSWGREKKEE